MYHLSLLQNIEQSSLCYTVGPWLSILNIAVCIFESQIPIIFIIGKIFFLISDNKGRSIEIIQMETQRKK